MELDGPTPSTRTTGARVPESLVVASEWAWRVLLVAVAIGAFVYGAAYLSFVVVPIVVAIFLTALLDPIRARLMRWGMSQGWASGLAFLIGTLLIVTVIGLAVRQVVSNFDELTTQVNEGVNRVTDMLSKAPFHLKTSGAESAFDRALDRFKKNPASVLSGAFSVLSTTGGLMAGGLLTFITTLFFVTDRRRIFTGLTAGFGSASSTAQTAIRAAWNVLLSYVKVTLTEALVCATVIGTSTAVVGIPISFTLGAVVFLLGFIPTIGAIVSGGLVVVAALVTKGVTQAIVMAIVVLVVQQLDANVLYPILTSRRLSLHPLASLLLVTSGGVVGGLFGAFLAVPIAAMLMAARASLVAAPPDATSPGADHLEAPTLPT